jgi:transposase InsO family protein
VQAFISSLESQGAISPSADSSVLNASISVEEVESALLRMKNGRMAGPDGMRGELLKGAYSEWELRDGTFKHLALSGELRDILDQAFSTGEVPTVWSSAYLCSVFKRGDATVKDYYRGIVVGSTMGKLYSMILEQRLSAFCEQHGFRATGQAGFRPDRRTSDPGVGHFRFSDPGK